MDFEEFLLSEFYNILLCFDMALTMEFLMNKEVS